MSKVIGFYSAIFVVSSLIFGVVTSIWGTSTEERFEVGLKAGLAFGVALTVALGTVHLLVVMWRRFQ